ncbi:hypothetical protein QZJ86_11230 [Methylomonas montana]|uniref:hypothetical protein n=1 Tax=Methylomonas montana TaxID=3058963 RepID=UPI00265B6C72|nr:hypothetical protein [Methylomonas montana]WKJ88598.1 hypothetical protein QZJ86_11230 [Methylomonas montana]
MELYVRNIKITPSDFEDVYYMPLAEIAFSIDIHRFQYLDYINPFSGKISAVEINSTANRHGSTKYSVLKKIGDSFNVDMKEALFMYLEVLPHLNRHLYKDPQAKLDFPRFELLQRAMFNNDFYDRSDMHFNYMTIANGVEKHIFAKSVKSAMDKLDHYLKTGDADEEHTYVSAQRECAEYGGVTLMRNINERELFKPWLISQKNGFRLRQCTILKHCMTQSAHCRCLVRSMTITVSQTNN